MKNYYYIFIGLILLLSGCKKESIPELAANEGSEGIFFSGMLGSESIELNSLGNYYMYSSYHFDTAREVYVFTGELKERYCTDCGTGIKLSVTNYKKSPGGILNFDYDSIFDARIIKWGSIMTTDQIGLAEIVVNKNNGILPMSCYNSYQGPENKLEIKSFEIYQPNELSQKTVKITFEGLTTLSTSSGDKLFVFNGSFAFAFP